MHAAETEVAGQLLGTNCDRHRRKDNSLREFQKEEHGKRQEERIKKREEKENDTKLELHRFLELSTGDNND